MSIPWGRRLLRDRQSVPAPPADTQPQGCVARDPVFDRWAQDGLVWLPERGMGYLPVREAPYDAAYFAKYERYAATALGHALTKLRRQLVDRWAGPETRVCDVGIGCGQFVESRPNTYGYDINPEGVRWLRTRGRWLDPYAEPVPVLTFWDSIEHIPDPAPLLQNAREWVFASLPIVPGDGPPRPEWRHYRPDEHCWYWTRRGFLAWMEAHGFRCVEHNTMESLAGREDIETFAFRRRAP